MKRLIAILMVMAVLCCAMTIPAFAEDVILKAKIVSATQAVDKNGNAYVRLIINESRTLQGHAYNTGVAVMAFGANAKTAMNMKAGDTLHCIADGRDYRGRKSYTVISFL